MSNKLIYSLTSTSWDKSEINSIKKVIKSDRYTYGNFVSEFEKKFARYFKKKYAVMVNSGSSANLISVAALFFKKKSPLKRGDEVIVPSISWSTSYFPLIQYGLKLRFVDVDKNTINCSADNIIRACTKKTQLILYLVMI